MNSIKYFFLLTLILTCFAQRENRQRGRPQVKQPSKRVNALKINFPYDLFADNSRIWRTTSPVYSDEIAQSNKYTKLSRAQDNEDIWLYENWFHGMTNGVILESGALDGIKYSTTFMFEHFAHWNTVHVEADPRNFYKLVRNRESGININAALCSETKMLHYTNDDGGQIQGFVEFMSPAFLRKWHKKIYNNITRLEDLATVQCVQMKRLMREINLRHIDIWILDVEGAELSVLQGTDFSELHVSAVVMECDMLDKEKDRAKQHILENNGFECLQVERNCFCKHMSFEPSKAPDTARSYDGLRDKATHK
mmetsp:Transcript_1886/g.3001  ORF Transcript_1886/g.3001 Transcript_1886/m.3001 type:complete len:309 (-) Transcript_1886:89-1015(-)